MSTNEFGQSPPTIESTPSTMISPEQLSVAINEIVAGTSDSQANTKSAGAVGAKVESSLEL